MKIKYASVFVRDQDKALAFYTDVLGFEPKADIPLGTHRWLTVVSPNEPDAAELLLEPNENPAAREFQSAIYGQGIPATLFVVDDIRSEHERLAALGVEFRQEPTDAGGPVIALLDDTCGNLIQLVQL